MTESSHGEQPAAPTRGDVVMLGDSLTADGPWRELFPQTHIRNLGVSGDTTAGVLARIDAATEFPPAKLFLLIGTNDLPVGVPPERIAENTVTIIERLRAGSPTTALTVQGILPREPFWAERITYVNALVAPEAIRRGARWLDLWQGMADGDGGLRHALTTDGLHLSPAGYRLWAAQIRPIVESTA